MPASAAPLRSTLQRAAEARRSGDLPAARDLYLQALAQHPGDDSLRLDAAAACLGCGDAAAALRCVAAGGAVLPPVLRWRQDLITAMACKRLQRPDEALAAYRTALAQPDLPPAAAAQARRELADLLLNTLGDPQGAAGVYGGGAASPADPIRTDLDPDPDAWLARLVAGLYTGGTPPRDLVAGFRAFAAHHLRPAGGPAAAAGPRPGLSSPARRRRRLRIGFISPQFCASPVGFLTLGTLEALSISADLVLFDRGAKADWAQARFRQAASQWVPCAGLAAPALRQMLAQTELDALVDLGGWMDLEALRALAGRPAPRQFKWVGGQSLTTGLDCFDGFLADARQVPAASAGLYVEPVLRFSQGYVTYTSPPYLNLGAAAARPPRPAAAPSPGVYALVSNPAKIGRPTVAHLQALQPRRLLLIDQRWRHAHTRQLVAQALGPLMERVEFITPDTHPDYLRVLATLDAAVVDTAPYAMGLTAIELRLLGKTVVQPRRPRVATMHQLHCAGHARARRFDHHDLQARELLSWCGA